MERRDHPIPSVIPDVFQTILNIFEGEKCQFSWTIRKNVEKFSLSVTMFPAKIHTPRPPPSPRHTSKRRASGTPPRRNSCPMDEENSAKVKESKTKSPSVKARDRKRRREFRRRKAKAAPINSTPAAQESLVTPAQNTISEIGSERGCEAEARNANKTNYSLLVKDLDMFNTASPSVNIELEPGLPSMSRKIYFCGSIRGGRQDAELYARLITLLQGYGTVLTEHVGDTSLTEKEMEMRTDKHIHDRDMDWLKSADYIVAEVTQASLGVGYEIGRAVALGKKILCLYRPQPDKKLSAMIAGAHDGNNFIVKEYSEADAEAIFKDLFK